MLEMIDDTVASVRRIAADLRPMMLDDLGLNAAIEWLARDAARRMDMEITVRLGEEDPPVTQGAAIALYRMVQEALTNVARHARATDVSIEMRQEGGELVLTVRDNGIGFSAPTCSTTTAATACWAFANAPTCWAAGSRWTTRPAAAAASRCGCRCSPPTAPVAAKTRPVPA